jgi:hypothetical protein
VDPVAQPGEAVVPAPAGLLRPGRQVLEGRADGDEPRLTAGTIRDHQPGVPQQAEVLGHGLAADR